MERSNLTRWVLGGLALLAVLALIAYSRNDAGVDGRAPDPEDARSATDGGG